MALVGFAAAVAAACMFWTRRKASAAALAGALIAFSATAQAQVNVNRIEVAPTEQWGGWENLGGATVSGADCVATQANRIDCFGSGQANLITRTQWDGQRWTGPTPMSGAPLHYLDARPECVSWAADHIDCFARSGNEPTPAFQRIIHGGFMTGWQPLGGALTSDPDCVSVRAERLDCFARGPDGSLLRNSFNGDIWSGWASRGGQVLLRTNPACVVFRGEINCVVVSPANTLRHFRFASTGVEARDMPGGVLQTPGVTLGPKCYVSVDPDLNSSHDDQIHCFAPRVGATTSFLARWGWGGQGNWSISNLGENAGPSSGAVDWDCVVRSSQRVDCVELVVRPPPSGQAAPLTSLRHRVFRLGQGVTISELNLPQPQATPSFIRCVSWSADRLDCFATGNNSPLLHAWLTPVERRGVFERDPSRPPIVRQPSN